MAIVSFNATARDTTGKGAARSLRSNGQVPAVIYDCFAGTGSLGLEALSRGAKFATFFEADRSAVTRLHQNIAALKVQDRSRVVAGDLFRWFELSTTRPDSTNATGADVVFLDPPYRFLRDHSDEILQLAMHLSHGHLKPGATIVFRHDVKKDGRHAPPAKGERQVDPQGSGRDGHMRRKLHLRRFDHQHSRHRLGRPLAHRQSHPQAERRLD